MIEPAFRSKPYIGLGFQLSDIYSIKKLGIILVTKGLEVI
jgi:hypothetical protein